MRIAAASHARTRDLVAALSRVPGVRRRSAAGTFTKRCFSSSGPWQPVLEALAERGILGGLDLVGALTPILGNALLVCATETKTDADIAQYARALGELQAAPLTARGAA